MPTPVVGESRTSYRWYNGSVGNHSVPPAGSHAFVVITEVASDTLQQYLAGVDYQRGTPVAAVLIPILHFVEYCDDGIFLILWHLPTPPSTNDDIEQSPSQGGITIEGKMEQVNGDFVRSDNLSVNQRADGACQLLHRGLNF